MKVDYWKSEDITFVIEFYFKYSSVVRIQREGQGKKQTTFEFTYILQIVIANSSDVALGDVYHLVTFVIITMIVLLMKMKVPSVVKGQVKSTALSRFK